MRKDEKSTQGIFYKPLVIDETEENDDVQEKTIPLAKIFSVFNLEKIDGLDDIKPEMTENKPFFPIPATSYGY